MTPINTSIAAGVVYVVAAGNNGADACSYSPARASNAITVGATDSSDARASFSNYGSCVDIFAPGSGITSAAYSSDTATTSMSGTSMASPHVAGAVALYLEMNSSATPSAVASSLTAAASTDVVTNAGTNSPSKMLFTRWIAPNASVISLRTGNSRYFIADGAGGGDVDATASVIGPWEKFNLIDSNGGTLESGDTVYLQVYKGQYFAAESGGGNYVKATVWAIGSWETFRMWKQNGSGTINSGDTIALQANSGHYVVAEGNGGGEVNANRTAIGAWETFTMVK